MMNKAHLNLLQYITPSSIGGAEKYLLRLCDYLRSRGHKVSALCKQDSPFTPMLKGVCTNVHGWRTHGKVDPLTLLKLVRLIRKQKFDLINTHHTTASLLGSIAGRITGVPVIARVAATNNALPFRFADHLIAVCQAVKEHLVKQGIPQCKIKVLYNGIDLEHYGQRLHREDARRKLVLPQDAKIVSCTARFIPRKGHRFLIDAAAEVLKHHPKTTFLLVGGGELEEKLKQRAQQLGIADRVLFFGFHDDVRPFLAASDLFVLPSLKEGLPNAVMEAMAMGVPVVATDVAGTSELIRSNETGILVPPADAGALAEATNHLLSEPAEALRMAKAAQQFVHANFDQRQKLAEVEAFFLQVARS